MTGSKTIGKFRAESNRRSRSKIYGVYSEETERVEKWHYNCGKGKFIYILKFRGGVLKEIERGGYGSGKSDCVGANKR